MRMIIPPQITVLLVQRPDHVARPCGFDVFTDTLTSEMLPVSIQYFTNLLYLHRLGKKDFRDFQTFKKRMVRWLSHVNGKVIWVQEFSSHCPRNRKKMSRLDFAGVLRLIPGMGRNTSANVFFNKHAGRRVVLSERSIVPLAITTISGGSKKIGVCSIPRVQGRLTKSATFGSEPPRNFELLVLGTS